MRIRMSLTLDGRRFVGIEFAVVRAEPPSFFIIHKRERLSPEQGALLIVRLFHPDICMISCTSGCLLCV